MREHKRISLQSATYKKLCLPGHMASVSLNHPSLIRTSWLEEGVREKPDILIITGAKVAKCEINASRIVVRHVHTKSSFLRYCIVLQRLNPKNAKYGNSFLFLKLPLLLLTFCVQRRSSPNLESVWNNRLSAWLIAAFCPRRVAIMVLFGQVVVGPPGAGKTLYIVAVLQCTPFFLNVNPNLTHRKNYVL